MVSRQAAPRKRAAEESAAVQPAKVARLESSESHQSAVETPQKLALDSSSPGAGSLDSERQSGLKRGSSFETPAGVKRKLFEAPEPGDSLAVLKESLGGAAKGLPVYYRLDDLWGKTPEKEAKPGLSADNYREREDKLQQEGLEKVEQKAKEVAKSLGMGGAVVPASKNFRTREAGRKAERARKKHRQACEKKEQTRPPEPGLVVSKKQLAFMQA